MTHFIDRLASAVKEKRTPILVGLDPRRGNLPQELQPTSNDHSDCADASREFCCDVIDAVAEEVAVVKPQMAFFEELGPHGMQALYKVIGHARKKGLLVILDGKRNDIGSTAQAYAAAYLGEDSAWRADALTVSPYLGDDSLEPFVTTAVKQDAGVFVLVKTSNPGGKTFQDLTVGGGSPLYLRVGELVENLAKRTAGRCGYGAVGAVAGATYPAQLKELRGRMPHSWLLVPGFGAQGAGAADVADAFDVEGSGAIINSSRGIIFAYEREEYKERYGQNKWRQAISAAAREMRQQLCDHTPAKALV